jgi:hypothetical protein
MLPETFLPESECPENNSSHFIGLEKEKQGTCANPFPNQTHLFYNGYFSCNSTFVGGNTKLINAA